MDIDLVSCDLGLHVLAFWVGAYLALGIEELHATARARMRDGIVLILIIIAQIIIRRRR